MIGNVWGHKNGQAGVVSDLYGYSDSDCARYIESRRPTSEHAILFQGVLVG